MENYKEFLSEPSALLRPHPFWQWNDGILGDSVARNFQQMKNAGTRGGFICLDDFSLQGEVRDALLAECTAESEKHGFETAVCMSGREYPACGKCIYLTDDFDNIKKSDILAVFLKKNDGTFEISDNNSDAKTYAVCIGESDGMILDKEAARKYFSMRLEDIPEVCVKRVCISVPYDGSIVPWCDGLEKKYSDTYKKDIIPSLISLFEKTGEYQSVRADFYRLCEKLYGEAVECAVNEIRKTHGVIFTVQKADADFPVYLCEYTDVAGIDISCDKDPITEVKCFASASYQTSGARVMAKCFEGMGWNISLEKLKNCAEMHIAGGADIISPAFHSQSLIGELKRKNSGSLFTHQSFYEHYRYFCDYISRVSALMSGGSDTADVLLLSPRRGSCVLSATERKRIFSSFELLSDTLSGLHVDFHIGDETVLEKHATVNEGTICVGKGEYSAVLIPKMASLSRSTAEMLMSFGSNGGKIVLLAPLPSLIDGEKDEETVSAITKLSEKSATDYESLITYLERKKLCSVRITCKDGNADGIRVRSRKYPDYNAYFIINSDNKPCNATVFIKGYESAVGLRMEDLCEIKLSRTEYPQGVAFNLKFEPGQSYVVLTAPEGALPEGEKTSRPATVISPKSEWEIEEAGHNALNIDTCTVIAGQNEQTAYCAGTAEIFRGIEKGTEYALKYEFEIDETFSFASCENIRLALENTEKYEIYVNERRVFYNGFSVWFDNSLEVIDIKDFVTKGKNTVLLKGVADGDDTAESIYITGDFGVYSRTSYVRTRNNAVCTDGPFYISAPQRTLYDGKLCDGGYPFFNGKMKLTQTLKVKKNYGERIYLDMDMPCAAFTNIRINGEAAVPLMWKNGNIDITEYVKRGKNKLTLELFINNRNLLGPHHHPQGEPLYTDQSAFRYYDNKALWRERYCFTDSGI